MHRWSILIIVQRVATQSSLFIILQVHSTYFVCQPHQLSVHKTVTTASGTVQLPHTNVAKLAWPRWSEVAAQKKTPVPEAVVTVLCIPHDGCGWHPKHLMWTYRIINRLLVLQLVRQLLIYINIFLYRFSKNNQMYNFIKSAQCCPRWSTRVDGQIWRS